MNRTIKKLLLATSLISMMAGAIDNHHFYRASNFFPVYHEPRLEECWLTSFDITVAGGSTRKSKNGCGTPFNACDTESCLLNICGFSNVPALSCGLPCLDLTNNVDTALNNLALLTGACCNISPDCLFQGCAPLNVSQTTFGMLSFAGKFNILEANFFFTQNFTRGFFFQAHLPVRRLKISNICMADLSPTDPNVFPNINSAQWQTFLPLFGTMLERYQLSICPTCSLGAGDLSLLAGWTINYEDTEILDFIDMTFRIGALFPTGKKANIDCVFSLPTGYNGHYGVPISFDLALGAFDCFTMGFHFDALPFIHKIQCLRVKTDANQEGLIKLFKVKADINQGLIWGGTGYLIADHFASGLSMLMGFTVAKKLKSDFRTGLCICDGSIINPPLNQSAFCLDCDPVYGSWTMETFHVLFEYDFGLYCPQYSPRISLFYNAPVGGRKIFDTGMLGGGFGIDVGWYF